MSTDPPSMSLQAKVSVLVIFYTRARTLRVLVDHLSGLNFKKIYFASDGPRDHEDIPLVQECRGIVESVNWGCEVEKLYSDTNLGLSLRNLTALDSVLAKESGVLVLEDDCIPQPQILQYLTQAIAFASINRGISTISCFNPLGNLGILSSTDFVVSRTFRSWGYFIFRETWLEYRKFLDRFEPDDFRLLTELRPYKGIATKILKFKILVHHRSRLEHMDILMQSYFRRQGQLTIIPSSSQIANVGFGSSATNTSFLPWYPNNKTGLNNSERDFSRWPKRSKPRKLIDVLEGWLILLQTPRWMLSKVLLALKGIRR